MLLFRFSNNGAKVNKKQRKPFTIKVFLVVHQANGVMRLS